MEKRVKSSAAPEWGINSKHDAGFTLIEFCIAILITMVGLLGLLQSVNIATIQNLGNLLRTEAASVADEQMVLARTSVNDAHSFAVLETSARSIRRKNRAGFANYSVIRTISTVSTLAKEAEVRVSWRYKGNKINHTIATLVVSP